LIAYSFTFKGGGIEKRSFVWFFLEYKNKKREKKRDYLGGFKNEKV
jgi:hypothetical protein